MSRKQFLSNFTYPAREFIYTPSYPYKKLTKILTSEGHIFYQELAFYLIEVSSQLMFHFVLRAISINKECLKVYNINVHRSWDEPRAKKTNLDLKKYINLSAIKGNQEFASYALLHVTCNLYYIFSLGHFSITPSLLNGPPWRNKIYLTLPYLTKAETQTRKSGYVTCHVQNSGERSL